MKIKIVSAARETYWYANYIGREYTVIKESTVIGYPTYHVGYGHWEGTRDELHVNKEDAVVVEYGDEE